MQKEMADTEAISRQLHKSQQKAAELVKIEKAGGKAYMSGIMMHQRPPNTKQDPLLGNQFSTGMQKTNT